MARLCAVKLLIHLDSGHRRRARRSPLPADQRPLSFADLDGLYPGQEVVAIGSPFGQAWTMTTGIISALDRRITFRLEQLPDRLGDPDGRRDQPGQAAFSRST